MGERIPEVILPIIVRAEIIPQDDSGRVPNLAAVLVTCGHGRACVGVPVHPSRVIRVRKCEAQTGNQHAAVRSAALNHLRTSRRIIRSLPLEFRRVPEIHHRLNEIEVALQIGMSVWINAVRPSGLRSFAGVTSLGTICRKPGKSRDATFAYVGYFLPAAEEKQLVLQDWPANGPPVLVSAYWWPFASRLVQEKVVGIKDVILDEVVRVPVEFVCA